MRFQRLPRIVHLAVATAVLCLWTGCGKDRAPTQGPVTLNEAVFSEPGSFDPRAQVDTETYGIMYAIYNTVVELDNEMKVVPALAEKWETDDFRTWRFHIRQDVWFHADDCFRNPKRTRLLVAEDIVFSLNRALRPGGVGAFVLTDIVEGAREVNEGKAETAKGIRASEPGVLEVVLKKPYRKLPERLATPFLFIVPREAVEAYGDGFGRRPVGTGPFQLAAVDPGRAVELRRNPRFWGKDDAGNQLPYLEGVRFRIFRDPQVALIEFRTGGLDAVEVPAAISSAILKEGRTLPEYSRFVHLETVALDVHYFAFRMDRPPFRGNPLLRQALNHAVDKERIAEVLLNGLAGPAIGVLPPGVFPDSPRSEIYPFDPDRARAEIAKAGYPGGTDLPVLTLAIDDKATTEVVAQYVQSNLADIGVKVKLRKSDFNTLLGEIGQGGPDFFYLFWEGTDPNAEIFMVQFQSELLPEEGGYNFGHYANPRADKLFEEAVSTIDDGESTRLWLEMNELIGEDAPWIFLYHTKRVRLLQPGISSYDHNPMQIRRFKTTRKQPR